MTGNTDIWEEIGQETLARKLEDKKIRVVLPDAASLIVEQGEELPNNQHAVVVEV